MKVTLFTGLGELSVEIITQQFAGALRRAGGGGLEVDICRPPGLGRRLLGKTRLSRAAFYLEVGLLYGLLAHRRQGDVNHVIDNQYAHLVHFLDPRRTVVTSHGGTPGTFHRLLGSPYRIHLRFFDWAMRGLAKARYTFVVSDYSKRELLAEYPAAAGRVLVMYPGVASHFRPPTEGERAAARRDLGIDDHTAVLLHVGHSGSRKNVEVVLKALDALRHRLDRKVVFVHVGQEFTAPQQAMIASLGLGRLARAYPAVQHAALVPVYQAADLFVFPSWYEGFGMPIVEAMASGLPVLCSDCELFREVAGQAALFFPATDAEALADRAVEVLSSGALSRRLASRGIRHSRQFSWSQYASDALRVYHEIVQEAAGRRCG